MPQMLIVEIMASSTFISLSLLYVFIDADIVFMVSVVLNAESVFT